MKKFCKDCKWCKIDTFAFSKFYWCTHPNWISPIDGSPISCERARTDSDSSYRCTYEGKFWEQK